MSKDRAEWKALCEDLGLSFAIIAESGGWKPDSIKSLLAPSKPLPRWAKFALAVYKLTKAKYRAKE